MSWASSNIYGTRSVDGDRSLRRVREKQLNCCGAGKRVEGRE